MPLQGKGAGTWLSVQDSQLCKLTEKDKGKGGKRRKEVKGGEGEGERREGRERGGRGREQGGRKEKRRVGVCVCVPMYIGVHHMWYTCTYIDI